MKLVFTSLLYFALTAMLPAQTNSVVAAGGELFVTPQGSLSWTMGEIAVETYRQGFGYLTQGFNQTFAAEAQPIDVLVYPNPTNDFAYIQTFPGNQYSLELYNLHMEKLNNQANLVSMDGAPYQIDLRSLGASVYILVMVNYTLGTKSVLKIIKI